MHKVYMSELVFFEVEVKDKLNKEMKERKIDFKKAINSILKEYFEIKELLESVSAARK